MIPELQRDFQAETRMTRSTTCSQNDSWKRKTRLSKIANRDKGQYNIFLHISIETLRRRRDNPDGDYGRESCNSYQTLRHTAKLIRTAFFLPYSAKQTVTFYRSRACSLTAPAVAGHFQLKGRFILVLLFGVTSQVRQSLFAQNRIMYDKV